MENRDPELRAARYLSVNLGVGTCTCSEQKIPVDVSGRTHFSGMGSGVSKGRSVDKNVDVMRPLL